MKQQNSVANPSYNEYTKSNLKIYQIAYIKFISTTKAHNLTLFFSLPFYCFEHK